MVENLYIYLLLGCASFLMTLVGGILAYQYKHKLNLIMGLTSGIILGVVALELLPEISELQKDSSNGFFHSMLALVFGFLLFHIIEKLVLIHHSHEDAYAEHSHPHIGILSATLFILHSFIDGLGIGIGFLANFETGILITIAVLGHNFADGLNTVSLMISNKNPKKVIFLYLLADALAPMLGIFTAIFLSIPINIISILLGYFAGSFLYIGSSEILPEAHRRGNSYQTIFMTLLGVMIVYLLTQISSAL